MCCFIERETSIFRFYKYSQTPPIMFLPLHSPYPTRTLLRTKASSLHTCACIPNWDLTVVSKGGKGGGCTNVNLPSINFSLNQICYWFDFNYFKNMWHSIILLCLLLHLELCFNATFWVGFVLMAIHHPRMRRRY